MLAFLSIFYLFGLNKKMLTRYEIMSTNFDGNYFEKVLSHNAKMTKQLSLAYFSIVFPSIVLKIKKKFVIEDS